MINSNTAQQIKKLKLLLADLTNKAKHVDSINENDKPTSALREERLFACELFSTESNKFTHYATEIDKNINSLDRLLANGNTEFAYEMLLKVEQQIMSLANGLNANKVKQKEANFRHLVKSTYKAKAYKKAVQNVIVPTQQLYQNLTEHHEFERRLAEMIAEREQQRVDHSNNSNNRLNQEILALHQRLGRCRQAISKIERQIELSEKRN